MAKSNVKKNKSKKKKLSRIEEGSTEWYLEQMNEAKDALDIPRDTLEEDRDLHPEMIHQYIDVYAKKVIGDRAIPDERDGMMPVERRILWAMYKLGVTSTGKTTKAARVIGEVIGRYNPHGDTAAYGSMVKLVKQVPNPPLTGEGNWGSASDPKSFGAMRYTEVKLSRLAEVVFLNRDLMKVTTMTPNFDNTTTESLVLPARLPGLLLNGSYGIAVGAASNCPAFTLTSIIAICKKLVSGKSITTKFLAKTLEFKTPHGGLAYIDPVDDEEDAELMQDLIEGGRAKIPFMPDYHLDEDNKLIMVNGFVPFINIGQPKSDRTKSLMDKVTDFDSVQSWSDTTDIDEETQLDYTEHTIKLKRGIKADDVEDYAFEVTQPYAGNMSYNMNVVTRKLAEDGIGVEADFSKSNIHQVLDNWLAFRTNLEVKHRTLLNEAIEKRNWDIEALLLAISHIDIIAEGLKRKDTEAHIKKGLKTTDEVVNFILQKRVIQLKALEAKDLKDELKRNKSDIKLNKALIKDPTPALIDDIKLIEKDLKSEISKEKVE